MSEEKFILEERIFPDLKRFCREYNDDVHIVNIDIEDEQFSYMDWREEIETAHKESSGIGFIVRSLFVISCKNILDNMLCS